MCLGIPMRIKKIKDDFAEVESGRLTRTINIQMLKDIKIGDYVIVHAGFAIQKVDPRKAKETLKLVAEVPLGPFMVRRLKDSRK
jgi:hydrogenase expression/formation protein HypC